MSRMHQRRLTCGSLARRRFFSMEEVVLALTAVVMGVIAVMSVLPIGLNANRDAVALATASNAADFLLHYMTEEMSVDPAVAEALPARRPLLGDDTAWSRRPLDSSGRLRVLFATDDVNAEFDPATHHNGLFRVEQISHTGGKDFVGDLVMWAEVSEPQVTGRMVSLHVEVSWPATLPYDNRQKQIYSFSSFIGRAD